MVLTLIIENSGGSAPSPSDVDYWASNFGLSHPVAADPGFAVAYNYIGTTGATSIALPNQQLIGPGMEVLKVNEFMISHSEIASHLPE